MRDDDPVLAALVQKLDWAAEDGSPVTGPDHAETARWVLRRWRSANRRVKDPSNREERIRDLVRGFIETSDPLSFPRRLKPDFEWLAEQLAQVLDLSSN
jgi:hypothetical protein